MELITPKEDDLPFLKNVLEESMLDTKHLLTEEFIVAKEEDKIIGCGRVKNHDHIFELCSIWVDFDHRKKGIGRQIIKKLLEKFNDKDVYLVTNDQGFDYFALQGFKPVKPEQYPEVLTDTMREFKATFPDQEVFVMEHQGH